MGDGKKGPRCFLVVLYVVSQSNGVFSLFVLWNSINFIVLNSGQAVFFVGIMLSGTTSETRELRQCHVWVYLIIGHVTVFRECLFLFQFQRSILQSGAWSPESNSNKMVEQRRTLQSCYFLASRAPLLNKVGLVFNFARNRFALWRCSVSLYRFCFPNEMLDEFFLI